MAFREQIPTIRVRAEAAAWLAGLRRPNRASELEGRFRRWLAESEVNRIAWQRQSDAWELAGGLILRYQSRRISRSRRIERLAQPADEPRRLLFAAVAVLSAALVALALAWIISSRPGSVTTALGERRVAVLPDGSRVTLNTDTRLIVRYDQRARRVLLIRGEALFDVIKGERRPFIVVAGPREIRALGTAFEVRRNAGGEIAVTLIEGRISIVPIGGRRPAPDGMAVLESPGERMTFAPQRAPVIDHPVLRQLIAWQNGDVVFNGTTLPDAAREMNRYSERHIRIGDPALASLRIGGLFQAGDSMEFARAVAETFGLDLREEGTTVVLLARHRNGPNQRSTRRMD